MNYQRERPGRMEARTGRNGFDRPQDTNSLPYSNRRTACPNPLCDSSDGFAPFVGDGGGGKCHACQMFFPPTTDGNPPSYDRPARPSLPPRTEPKQPPTRVLESTPWEISAVYPYYNEGGVLLYTVTRRERRTRTSDNPATWKREKTFWQCPAGLDRPSPGCMSNIRLVLYELPSILSTIRQGERVLVVEGERDADTLNDLFRHELGTLDRATTSPGGAGSWRPEYAESLRGGNVIVWPDGDEPGRRHGEMVRVSLQGVARSVIMVPPGRDKPTTLVPLVDQANPSRGITYGE